MPLWGRQSLRRMFEQAGGEVCPFSGSEINIMFPGSATSIGRANIVENKYRQDASEGVGWGSRTEAARYGAFWKANI